MPLSIWFITWVIIMTFGAHYITRKLLVLIMGETKRQIPPVKEPEKLVELGARTIRSSITYTDKNGIEHTWNTYVDEDPNTLAEVFANYLKDVSEIKRAETNTKDYIRKLSKLVVESAGYNEYLLHKYGYSCSDISARLFLHCPDIIGLGPSLDDASPKMVKELIDKINHGMIEELLEARRTKASEMSKALLGLSDTYSAMIK